MASRTAGIPGLGVLLASVGGFLIYAGVKNVPIVSGVQSLLKGKLPTGTPSAPTELPDWLNPLGGGSGGGGGTVAGGGTALGLKIAMYAKQYVGVPYRWGGNSPTSGWDCSGLVTWCLVHNGVTNLPGSRPTSFTYMTWSGARTIPREQAAAGDLCCWSGHIGIAVSNTDMINAPTFGIPTRIQKIYGGVTIRRIIEG